MIKILDFKDAVDFLLMYPNTITMDSILQRIPKYASLPVFPECRDRNLTYQVNTSILDEKFSQAIREKNDRNISILSKILYKAYDNIHKKYILHTLNKSEDWQKARRIVSNAISQPVNLFHIGERGSALSDITEEDLKYINRVKFLDEFKNNSLIRDILDYRIITEDYESSFMRKLNKLFIGFSNIDLKLFVLDRIKTNSERLKWWIRGMRFQVQIHNGLSDKLIENYGEILNRISNFVFTQENLRKELQNISIFPVSDQFVLLDSFPDHIYDIQEVRYNIEAYINSLISLHFKPEDYPNTYKNI